MWVMACDESENAVMPMSHASSLTELSGEQKCCLKQSENCLAAVKNVPETVKWNAAAPVHAKAKTMLLPVQCNSVIWKTLSLML